METPSTSQPIPKNFQAIIDDLTHRNKIESNGRTKSFLNGIRAQDQALSWVGERRTRPAADLYN